MTQWFLFVLFLLCDINLHVGVLENMINGQYLVFSVAKVHFLKILGRSSLKWYCILYLSMPAGWVHKLTENAQI